MSIRSPRTLAFAICLALSAVGGTVQAQTVGYNVRTGDVWVDSRLGEINDYGTRYRDPFINELSSNYGAPRPYVNELLTVRRWAPADVYYACAIAHALHRPCAEIVREYDRHPGQGWGVLAKRMGIKPGSKAFHELKRGTVATYDRWGYPVVIDRNVHVDWSKHGPDHGKAKQHSMEHGEGGHAHSAATSTGHGKAHGASGKAKAKVKSGNAGKSTGKGKEKGKDKDKSHGKGKGG